MEERVRCLVTVNAFSLADVVMCVGLCKVLGASGGANSEGSKDDRLCSSRRLFGA